MQPNLKIVALEVTSACNLNCLHCRGNPSQKNIDELTTEEILGLLDEFAKITRPMVILSGGEPLLRKDLFQIASYGSQLGLKMALATNGTLLTFEIVQEIKKAGIKRVSISFDGADASSHDNFRQTPGCFNLALEGVKNLKENQVEFQINATITKKNLHQLDDLFNLACSVGAKALHLFFLVPTGKASLSQETQEITREEYEDTLVWLCEKMKENALELKVTCAPQFFRIASSQNFKLLSENYKSRKGCLAGINFVFISSQGDVFPCGYLPVLADNIRKKPFSQIWLYAEVFQNLRDINKLQGKCARCDYKIVCGGCRARAYAKVGNYLAEEPFCIYQPGLKT